MCNIRSNKRVETKNIIKNYKISNLITLINIFISYETRTINKRKSLIVINNFSIFALSRNKRRRKNK